MENIIENLIECPLFEGISKNNISDILSRNPYRIMTYRKNQMIAMEGEKCLNIGIIINGTIEVKKIYTSGRSITITVLDTGDIFGEALVFSSFNKFPSTITSLTDSKVLFFSKEDIIDLCHTNMQFLNNIMGLLSNKVLILNSKIKSLSCQTLRQKIANYLIHEYEIQGSLHLKLSCSRKEMAELLGLPRPSLSRELAKMKSEGIIEFNRNIITITNLARLENSLLL